MEKERKSVLNNMLHLCILLSGPGIEEWKELRGDRRKDGEDGG